MRDLIAAKARKAKANGHLRDHAAEAKIKAMNMAVDLMGEIQSRHPKESQAQHLDRFFRAVSHSTDPDLFDMFFGDHADGEYVEVLV